MREATQGSRWKSSDLWETLEQMVRGRVQEFIQEILEDEVTEFLGGRAKSQRRASVEAGGGDRNGYGKPRNLTLASGTVEVCRPRVRDVEERFEEPGAAAVRAADEGGGRAGGAAVPARPGRGGLRVGPAGSAGRRCAAVEVHGAPPAGAVGRGARRVGAAFARGRELVYAWADGIYVKAGLEKDKAALLGRHRSHGRRHQGSPRRGAGLPRVGRVVGRGAAGPQGPGARRAEAAGGRRQPGHLGGGPAGVAGGRGAAVLEPQDGQRARSSAEARAVGGEAAAAGEVVYAESRAGGREDSRRLPRTAYADTYPKAVEILAGDWDRMTAFFDFPAGHWRHLRTTNVVESPFAAVRLRTSAASGSRRSTVPRR